MLTAAYYILKDSATYAELGAAYFERRSKTQTARRLVKLSNPFGLIVGVRPARRRTRFFLGSMNRLEVVVEGNFAHLAAQLNALCDCVPEVKPDVDARVTVFFRCLGEARE
jgi:hypothetical protein